MANTPKPLRKAVRAYSTNHAKSAEWWVNKATQFSTKAASRASGLTSPQEASILATQQFRTSGDIPITYSPTNTIDPTDPRTFGAGYDERTRTLKVEWGDGGQAYQYYNVPPEVWATFQRTPSPGRYINSTLNFYKYGPV